MAVLLTFSKFKHSHALMPAACPATKERTAERPRPPVPALMAAVFLCLFSSLARGEILIGTAGPLTGPYAWSGEQFRLGSEMAVREVNAAGGVLGQQVMLIAEDDAADPEQAVAVANKLVAEGVVFVAGHWASGASISAAKVYEDAGILMISPSSTNPRLTEEGRANVFRVCGRDDRQGSVAGKFLAEEWGQDRIAIIHDGTIYGEGLAEATRDELRKNGGSEALYEPYIPGEQDYSPLIAKLRAMDVKALFVGGYAPDAGLMIRQARDEDYDLQLVSGDALSTEDFWLTTGPAGDGTLFTFFPDPRLDPENAGLVERFRSEGVEPDGYTLYAYGAVQVWAQAVQAADTLELETVVSALREETFDTVLGELDFDEKGDIETSGFSWYVWDNGDYRPVARKDAHGRDRPMRE